MASLPINTFIKFDYLTESLFTGLENSILELIDEHTRKDMGLTFIPDVVKALLDYDAGYTFTLDQILTAFIKLSQGTEKFPRSIEIRPESGMNRLSDEELTMCPKIMWNGYPTPYSWARIV